MLLNKKEGYHFEMKYYNADGNVSTMCGNGGRCIVKFAYDRGIVFTDYHFLAVDGPHDASFDENNWVKLRMKDVTEIDHRHNDIVLDTGSPHYIKFVHDVMSRDVYTDGRRIRYNDEYEKDGINVNFVEQAEDHIIVRTYERGVEDETLSCGTGVTAAALMSAHNDLGFNRIEVITKGGRLAVEFDKTGENTFENIFLCGPATFVFKGELTLHH
jgi:diaminopimelate epimerase